MSVGVGQVSGLSLAALRAEVAQFADGRLRMKVLGVLSREITAAQRAAFAAEASPNGVPWAPLKRPRPGKKLHRSGELERRATRPIFRGQGFEYSLPIYGPRQLWGYPAGNTPARPYMVLDPVAPALQQRFITSVNALLQQTFGP